MRFAIVVFFISLVQILSFLLKKKKKNGIHSIQDWTATKTQGVTRKRSIKRSKHTGSKATKIIGQRKAFYRKRIPEFSCAGKETVGTDILLTSRNDDRKSCNLSE